MYRTFTVAIAPSLPSIRIEWTVPPRDRNPIEISHHDAAHEPRNTKACVKQPERGGPPGRVDDTCHKLPEQGLLDRQADPPYDHPTERDKYREVPIGGHESAGILVVRLALFAYT